MKFKNQRTGFTLIESLVSLSILSIAASALLLGIQSSMQSVATNVDRTIALGMATQLLDEIAGQRYMEAGSTPDEYPLGASVWELGGNGRERFNDIDDYTEYTAKEPVDLWGVPIARGSSTGSLRHVNFRIHPNYFQYWRQTVRVGYVDENDPAIWLAGSSTSNHRAVEVVIYYDDPRGTIRELAKVKRVFSYVPKP